MTDREAMEQAQERLELWLDERGLPEDAEAIAALRERLAQPEQKPVACKHGWIRTGAMAEHERRCIYCGAWNDTKTPEQEPETVMAEYKFQTYAAYKTPDGEMKIGVVPDDAPLTLNGVPLYPRREWVGLTEDELWDLWNSYIEEPFPEWFVDFKQAYKVIEAKLKEKNT